MVDDGLLGGLAWGVVVLDSRLQRAGFRRRGAWELEQALAGNAQGRAGGEVIEVCVGQGAEEAAHLLFVLHGPLRGWRAVLAAGGRAVDAHRGRGCSRRLDGWVTALLARLTLAARGRPATSALGFLARLDLGGRQVGRHPVGHVHSEVFGPLHLAGLHAVDGRLVAALQRCRLERRVEPQRIQVHLILRAVLGAAVPPWAAKRRAHSRRAGRVGRVCSRHCSSPTRASSLERCL